MQHILQLKSYARYLRMNLSKRSTTRGKCKIWQSGLSSCKGGDTKLEIFLPKNQHTQRKLLNFENWCMGEVSKSAKV